MALASVNRLEQAVKLKRIAIMRCYFGLAILPKRLFSDKLCKAKVGSAAVKLLFLLRIIRVLII